MKKILLVSLISLGFVTNLCAQTAEQIKASEESVKKVMAIISKYCEVERARSQDISGRFLMLEKASIPVLDTAKAEAKARITKQIASNKLQILSKILPRNCFSAITVDDMTKIIGIDPRQLK